MQDTRNDPVPMHLRNAVTGLMRGLGYGRDYRYSHDYAEDDPARWAQRYLPDNVADRRFYEPGEQGFERAEIAPRLEHIRRLRDQQPSRSSEAAQGRGTARGRQHGEPGSAAP